MSFSIAIRERTVAPITQTLALPASTP